MKSRLLINKFRRPVAAFFHDFIMTLISWMGAFWLRFNLGEIPEEYYQTAIQYLPLVIVIQTILFIYFGLYRGVWRFASLPDLIRILKAVLVGACIIAVMMFLLTRSAYIPRSVYPLYAGLLMVMLGGSRLTYRWLRDRHVYFGGGKRVLIVGAGSAGEMLVRDMLRDPIREYNPVVFVDDNKEKFGSEIHGVRVRGACIEIPKIARDYDIEIIMIAMPSANTHQMQKAVKYCEKSGLPVRTTPRLQDLMTGRVGIQSLHELDIEDLLGREPITLDWQAIHNGLDGKTIAITGGGGSIGSELCRQILRLNPKKLIVIDNSEFNLYQTEKELNTSDSKIETQFYLTSVIDEVAIDHIFSLEKPEVVFHAAAYKHVPILENRIREAVKNNVLGTRVVAQAADRHKCSEFVLISTDKAVNPTNVMGGSKRIAEIYCQNLNGVSETRYITVRFGNVLDSAGSVVPLFRSQIESGGPVTVTHPDIERYFMTIPEACQLIMQAACMGKGGEIYVLDMGEPIKIQFLAEQMIHIAGKQPGEDIEIIYSGLRPGEKLFEELFHESELLSGTTHKKILLARHRKVDWNYLNEKIDKMSESCSKYDESGLKDLLKDLVPEYKEQEFKSDTSGKVVPFAKSQLDSDAS